MVNQFPIVRPALADDAVRIAEIYAESIEAHDSTMVEIPASAIDVERMICAPRNLEETWVVDLGSLTVGWGQIRPYSQRHGYRFAAETSLFICRKRLGQGLGTVLQRTLIERCEALGLHHLVAKIFADNQASIRLHEKLGYDLVGIQREIGFKQGRWQDVAIMGLVLDDRPAHD